MTTIKSNYQQGFTMIELLVFMMILATFVVFLLGVVINIFRSQSVSQDEEQLQNEFVRITNELTQQLRWSDQAVIEDYGDQDVIIVSSVVDGQESVTRYELIGEQLMKDSQPLSTDQVSVLKFDVQNLVGDDELPLLQFTFGLQANSSEQQILDKNFVISLREQSSEIEAPESP